MCSIQKKKKDTWHYLLLKIKCKHWTMIISTMLLRYYHRASGVIFLQICCCIIILIKNTAFHRCCYLLILSFKSLTRRAAGKLIQQNTKITQGWQRRSHNDHVSGRHKIKQTHEMSEPEQSLTRFAITGWLKYKPLSDWKLQPVAFVHDIWCQYTLPQAGVSG